MPFKSFQPSVGDNDRCAKWWIRSRVVETPFKGVNFVEMGSWCCRGGAVGGVGDVEFVKVDDADYGARASVCNEFGPGEGCEKAEVKMVEC